MKLVMISAMYENGGNALHRHLDGHPELFVYPFESQLGTPYVADDLGGMFPQRYRWPTFPLGADLGAVYEAFCDEELKTRLRRPEASKFRAVPLAMEEADRSRRFAELCGDAPASPGLFVTAMFRATFDAWRDVTRTGRERLMVGFSPVVVVDAPAIFRDLPDARVIHVVRDPVAAWCDTRRRPHPLDLPRYAFRWSAVQHRALAYRELYPDRVTIVRYEDLAADPGATMRALAAWIGIEYCDVLTWPSFNGRPLGDELRPWGDIGLLALVEQRRRVAELDPGQARWMRVVTRRFADELGYGSPRV